MVKEGINMSFGKEKVWNWKTKKQGKEQLEYIRKDSEALYNVEIDFLQYGKVQKEVVSKERKPDIRHEGPTGS